MAKNYTPSHPFHFSYRCTGASIDYSIAPCPVSCRPKVVYPYHLAFLDLETVAAVKTVKTVQTSS